MRRAILPAAVAVLVLGVVLGVRAGESGGGDVVDRALHGDGDAIAALRAEGPAGLQRLLDACAADLAKGPPRRGNELVRPQPERRAPRPPTAEALAAWERVRAATDAVAGQRDAWASKLYWYTDLEQAKAAAEREHKPILSLRLLGRLDSDLSCANSRFFRTTLYPDPAVNELLREKFILHWSSERPVPVVTIDFGDGRTIKRTITGNSIHYVLDEQGRPIDGIPGLYAAGEFVKQLKSDLELHEKLANQSGPAWQGTLADHHQRAAQALDRQWPAVAARGGMSDARPDRIDEQAWERLAAMNKPDKILSPQAVAVIAAKMPAVPAAVSARRAASKMAVESPLVAAVRRLQDSITQDTLRNEFLLHRQIHDWFCTPGTTTRDFDTLNTAVYNALFLTPRSDPWLGLAPAEVYFAIDDGGLASR